MIKVKHHVEPQMNTIENVNATDKGRFFRDSSLDIVICDTPTFKNNNDRLLNNWSNETEYYQWFKIFVNIVSIKLKKTGIFYLIGDLEDIHPLISIIQDADFQLTMTYYFTKSKKINVTKKSKDNLKNHKIIECVLVFTRNFIKKVKKILKLKQTEQKLSAKEINIELSGNGNGGGYWSLYCGDNSKNILPSEEHWNKLCDILKIDIDYSDINTQFRPYEGINLWEDVYYEDDKLLSGINRPILFYERLIEMNRRNPSELIIWDPFCGYGNSTKAFKKLECSYYACEFDPKIYYKALINTGSVSNTIRPVNVQVP